MPQGTVVDIPQEEHAQMLAALRRSAAAGCRFICCCRARRAATRWRSVVFTAQLCQVNRLCIDKDSHTPLNVEASLALIPKA